MMISFARIGGGLTSS